MTGAAPIAFDNSYARLPPQFYAPHRASPVARPRLVCLNTPLAEELGLDAGWLAGPEGVAMLAGNLAPPGAQPIALAYAGHQFGSFVPRLGDGRAMLLGEIVGPDGRRHDLQLKGSGPTPFSRRGDGRAGLGPVLREYLVSEAMAALGIPTTRALAAIATGEWIERETPVPGAVLARVAASHIRVGTFEYFAAAGDTEAVQALADYAIARHDPALAADPQPYVAFLRAVTLRQARLVARWLLVGFVHGVMNTDNTSIAGETIDYGPCAFIDAYDPAAVFSSIDHGGRYAYGNQPRIAQWNLARLAEALLPLLGATEAAAIAAATSALEAFPPAFQADYETGLRRKIGLATQHPDDASLVRALLTTMADGAADFTRTFRILAAAHDDAAAAGAFTACFANPSDAAAWLTAWRSRLAHEPGSPPACMRAANPAYIPRNHLVEEALVAAIGRDDFSLFEALRGVLADPFTEQNGAERFAAPPAAQNRVYRTFCGT